MKLRAFIGVCLVVPGTVFGEIELDEYDTSPLVISPTRLKQSQHDTPASVTRITKDVIRDLQITKLDEVLKYVAGMISANASGNQPRINYHGTSGLVPRRMQVLIDGVSVYRSGYAEVVWPTLPISVDDIEVVEVTRSPSAAAYGTNSMMAVINIKTKDPLSVDRTEVRVTSGSQETRKFGVSSGGEFSENARYRFSINGFEDEGYDENFAGLDRHDGTRSILVNGKIDYVIDDDTRLDAFIGFSDVETELEFRDRNQTSFPDIDTKSIYAIGTLYQAFEPGDELKIKASYVTADQEVEWGQCYPTALFSDSLRALHLQNPDYAESLRNNTVPTGGSASDDQLRDQFLAELATLGAAALEPWCGTTNENTMEGRYGVEAEFTSIVNDSLRYVIGGSAYRNWIESETFVNGKGSSNQFGLFGNAEMRFGRFVFNLGGMVEHEPSNLEDPAFSPRIGVNYRLTGNTSIRAVLSRSVRTPDILEYDRDWSYRLDSTDPYPLDGETSKYFYFNSKSDGKIKSEEILAREISLFHSSSINLDRGKLNRSFDFKFFRNNLDNLVSEKLQFFDYNPTNDGEVRLTGFEFEADFKFENYFLPEYVEYVSAHMNYAYIDNDTDEFFETSLHADHSGAAYIIARAKAGYFGSLAYYGNSEIQGESADAFEFGLGRDYRFNTGTFTLKGKVVYRPDKVEEFTSSETFAVKNIYGDSTSFFITAEYRLK